jgi:hypothetical protein
MSDTEGVPDDVMQAANQCVAQFRWSNDGQWHLFVARAILAERARCLKVASDEAEKRFENKEDYPATRVHDFLVVARAIEVGIGRRLPVTKSEIPIIEEAGGF